MADLVFDPASSPGPTSGRARRLLPGRHVGGRRTHAPGGGPPDQPRRRDGNFQAGAGSAVVFTNDGFLLTNAHVVGRPDAGKVAFADGTTVPFHVVGTDPLSDLASCGPTATRRLPPDSGRRPPSKSASWWWRSATRSVWRGA